MAITKTPTITAGPACYREANLQKILDACLIVDDGVQDKRHARVMEWVNRQYSGKTHGLVKGIGVVNLVHGHRTDYYPIDFRVYAPAMDGLTKNEHFRDMLRRAYREKGIQAETILFDSW